MNVRLFIGLGNPGPRYSHTRHNVGFRCIDLLARQWGITMNERRATVVLGQGRRQDQDVVLAKPRTFMNRSGEAVSYLRARFGIQPADLVVIYDEAALPVGKLRLRTGGSDAGHNGIKSIIAALGTQEFPRIRVGIGPPPGGAGQVSHVLGSFSTEEAPVVDQALELVAQAADCLLQESIQAAMNRFN
jgi:PTH1 family peptidyl-tRNA hydrolase